MQSDYQTCQNFPSAFVSYVYPALEDESMLPQDAPSSGLVTKPPFHSYFESDKEDAPSVSEDISGPSYVDVDDCNLSEWRDKRNAESINSFTSASTASFAGTQPAAPERPVPAPRSAEPATGIDQRLNFIFSSLKRGRCGGEDDSLDSDHPARTRKSRTQVEKLQRELGGCSNVTSKQISEAAFKAGLKKLQVYKWYWDNRKRGRIPS